MALGEVSSLEYEKPWHRLWASTVHHTVAAAISIGYLALGRRSCGSTETGRQADRRPWSAESSSARKGPRRIPKALGDRRLLRRRGKNQQGELSNSATF